MVRILCSWNNSVCFSNLYYLQFSKLVQVFFFYWKESARKYGMGNNEKIQDECITKNNRISTPKGRRTNQKPRRTGQKDGRKNKNPKCPNGILTNRTAYFRSPKQNKKQYVFGKEKVEQDLNLSGYGQWSENPLLTNGICLYLKAV